MNRYLLMASTALILMLAGCAQQELVDDSVVLYPPLPQQPRIQYLTTIKSESDLAESQPSAFRKFVVGDEQKATVKLGRPMAIAHRPGEILIVDRAYKAIIKIDLATGEFSPIWDSAGGRFASPISMAHGPDGRLYIVDAGRSEILVYNERLEFEESIALGEGANPRGIAISDNTMFVTDFDKNVILVYDARTYELIDTLGGVGIEPGFFRRPTFIAVDQSGYLYVTDTLNNRVQRLSMSDPEIKTYGYNGNNIGALVRPKGLDIDRDGNLYVADAAFAFVTIFDTESRTPRMPFGKDESGIGNLFLPNNVHIDYDNVNYFRRFAHPYFDIEYLIYVPMSVAAFNVYGFGTWSGPLKANANKRTQTVTDSEPVPQSRIGSLQDIAGKQPDSD